MTSPALHPDFAAAIVKMQGQLEGAKKGRANPAFRSKYADLAACWDACEEALQGNNLAVLQFPCKAEPGHVGLLTILLHAPTGEFISQEYQLPLKDATNPQAAGSAITYARRYALCSVLGICPEDDDGNKAAESPKATAPKTISGQDILKSQQAEEDFRKSFLAETDITKKKAIYTAVKNSTVLEPNKTVLLTEFAEAIKAASAKK